MRGGGCHKIAVIGPYRAAIEIRVGRGDNGSGYDEDTVATDAVETGSVAAMVAARMGSFTNWRKWLSRSSDKAPVVSIEPGALYGHMAGERSVELARIIDIATDEFGIRHVRFHLGYRYQHKIMEAGERTLAMPSFTARFTRRLDTLAE